MTGLQIFANSEKEFIQSINMIEAKLKIDPLDYSGNISISIILSNILSLVHIRSETKQTVKEAEHSVFFIVYFSINKWKYLLLISNSLISRSIRRTKYDCFMSCS